MNAYRKMLIDVARHLQDTSCRCVPVNPIIDWHTGAATCAETFCPRQNSTALTRILQLLGDSDVHAGAEIVNHAHHTEMLDTDHGANGDVLREIIGSLEVTSNS